mgnify:CR=1 FL=1
MVYPSTVPSLEMHSTGSSSAVKESGAVLLQPLNSVIVEPLFTTREALDKYQLVEKAKKLETLVSEEELNIQKFRKFFLR